jgi:murein DD-endopeptidase MepM/ murein hydrolase activator NlpD
MSRRPIHIAFVSALVLTMFAATTAAAQDGDLDATRERREQIIGELDVMRSTDLELKAEASRLAEEQEELEHRLDDAQVELDSIRHRQEELGTDLVAAERAESVARAAANDRAVAAYMKPRGEASARLLQSRDLNEMERVTTLVTAVADEDRRVIGEHVAAKRSLEGVRSELADAELRAEELRSQRAADVETLRAARARHAEVEQALDARIDDFQSEADALAAQEAEIAALIAERAAPAEVPVAETVGATSTVPAGPSAPSTPATSSGGGGGGPSATAAPTTPRPQPTSPPSTASPPPSSTSLAWPASGPVTSPFGPRWGRMHNGIDIGASMGQGIVAAAGGTVIFSGVMSGFGEVVLIDHGGGLVTLYAHQSQRQVSNGQSVSRGQRIGLVGSTGNSTGPHLHFETRVSGTSVDPMRYL